ncbi:MAG: PIN domain-containing protein [Burkholderiaceae bacterium]|nr:PIN domain-containing protein [Burkholderiaceae bacterium]
MKEQHLLVDYENVQPSLEVLAKLAPGFTDVWLFHGPKEAKNARAIAASHARVTLVPHSGKGKNALDFHLSFYLGYVAAKHPDAELVVVANDKGYDSMIDHAKALGFAARRDGYKAPATKKASVVKPAASTAAPVAAKKVAAKKTVAKKAVVKQAAPKPAVPAKVAVAKKAPPAKKAPVAKKAAAKKAAAPKPAKAAQPGKPPKVESAPQATPEAKTLARIQKGLIKMGSKAPQKVKPFLRHVGALLGQGSTAEQIDAMVAKLEAAGSVWFIGDEVMYGRK